MGIDEEGLGFRVLVIFTFCILKFDKGKGGHEPQRGIEGARLRLTRSAVAFAMIQPTTQYSVYWTTQRERDVYY